MKKFDKIISTITMILTCILLIMFIISMINQNLYGMISSGIVALLLVISIGFQQLKDK